MELYQDLILNIIYGLLVFIAGVSSNLSVKLLKDRKTERSAVCSLLRLDILKLHRDVTHRGYILSSEREVLDHLTTDYFELGGNGMISHICRNIDLLPVKDDLQNIESPHN